MEFTLAQAVFTIISANFGLIIVFFGFTLGIYYHIDKKIDATVCAMKDIHGRLCALEEKYRQIK